MSDKDAKIFFEKALKFFKEKKFDLVEKNFEDALKLAPGRVSILENLASIYLINKKFEKSENALIELDKKGVNNDKLDEIKFYVLKNLKKNRDLENFLKDWRFFCFIGMENKRLKFIFIQIKNNTFK